MSVDRTPPGQGSPPDEAKQRRRRSRGGIGCVVLVVLAFAGCSALASIGRNSDHSDTDLLVYQQTAKDLCQDVVKRRLKAPASATFTDVTASGTKDALAVEGTVNSQNSFGALLAASFSCSGSVDSSETVNVQLESFDG